VAAEGVVDVEVVEPAQAAVVPEVALEVVAPV
jgi:hypothetical protein